MDAHALDSDKYYFDLNLVLSETGIKSIRKQYSVYDSFGFIGSFIVTLYGSLYIITNILTTAYFRA